MTTICDKPSFNVPNYKNHTALCKDHREPSLNYTPSDIIEVINQYHDLIYKQWHGFYKSKNEHYEQILNLIQAQFAQSRNMSSLMLTTALKQSIDYIKNEIIAHISDKYPGYMLAPHIVMRTYNLFVSLEKSLEIYVEHMRKGELR